MPLQAKKVTVRVKDSKVISSFVFKLYLFLCIIYKHYNGYHLKILHLSHGEFGEKVLVSSTEQIIVIALQLQWHIGKK